MGKSEAVNSRFMELEGLRGLAAIIVVIFHSLLLFYPGMMYGQTAYGGVYQPNMPLESAWYGNPFNGILSGTFAVSIFFVLSGFVLTIGFFQKKDANIIKKLAAKRYIRLMLPALASLMIACLLMKLGLDIGQGKTAAITHSAWLQGLWTTAPHFMAALNQGLYGMFVSPTAPLYNPVLWTIFYEMMGSIVVFAAALLFGESRYRWVLYVVLAFFFWNTWLIGFVIGMAMADVSASRKKLLENIPQIVLWLCLLIGIVLGGYPANETVGTIYNYLALPQLPAVQNQSFYTALGAGLVVLSVLLLPRVSRFFAHKRVSVLGKYTYSLYLIHMPLLLTVCTGLFILFHVRMHLGLHTASVLAIALYFAVVGVATYLFERYVDKPSIQLSGVFADIYFGRRKLSPKLLRPVAYIKRRAARLVRRSRPAFVDQSLDVEPEQE